MRFRKLELQGYKSFANRTEFAFEPGVTAIIGPNGSGKSNVADAVRWVLGEQSFNLLRGKKTEDMIFAGSDQRPRLGMAEVCLTLDNSDHSLPLDFGEVTISRRAFRSGENEYLLNGNRVRLKEIADLLARSGLGRRTYAVIGQGLVDQVLSQRPEERRALFEEAAGITGQQAKRDEALRRLEETGVNLQRVQDLAQEMAPRLRHLKQAADKANQARQLQTDLQALLRTWYGYRWHRLLGELDRARQAEQAGEAAYQQAAQGLRQEEADLQTLRQRQVEMRQRLGDWHRAASVLHRQAEAVQRELAVSEERQRQAAARQREAVAEIAHLQGQEAAAQARRQALQETAAALATEAQSGAEVVRRAEGALEAERQAGQAQGRAVAQAQAQLGRLAAAEQGLQAQLAQIGERQAALEKMRREHVSASESAQKASAAASEALQALRAEETEAQAESARRQQSLDEQNALLEQREGEHRQLAAALADLQREGASLQSRLDVLTRLHNEGAGLAGGVRAVLAEAASPRSQLPRGIMGAVASLLRVPDHLEMALEVALGGQLHDIVVETWEVAEQAIGFLKRGGGGRASFLPLDTIRPAEVIRLAPQQGVVGVAADLVEAEPHLRRLVQYLLNRIVVVEDLAAARRARQSVSNGPLPTFVTLEGDLVRPGGSVSGGSPVRSRQEGSVLARERERRQLPAQLEALKGRSRQIEGQLRQVEERRREALEAQRQLRRAQETAAQARTARLERMNQAQRELDLRRQRQQWYADLARQAGEDAAALATRQAAARQGLQENAEAQNAAQSALAAAQQAVAALMLTDLEDALAAARAHAAMAQARLASHEALMQQARLACNEAAAQVSARQARAAQQQAELERLSAQAATAASQEGELAAQLKAYQERIEPAEAELAQLEATQTAGEMATQRQRQQVRQLELQLNQARLELERRQDAQARLRRDIEHDFGLVSLERNEATPDQPPLPLGALVETLPVAEALPEGLESDVQRLRQQLSRLGNINPDAPTEYQQELARQTFLTEQAADLEKAAHALREVIAELEKAMEREFRKTFRAVAEQFKEYFSMLFGGGSARLSLTDGESLATTGIEIIARPPGKRPQSLALLSGGERALTAAALIFSVLSVNPPPFCILDEVDAALDEANVGRFRDALSRLAAETQFIVITHNRGTVEAAQAIYGVSMGADNASQVLSLRLEEASQATSQQAPA